MAMDRQITDQIWCLEDIDIFKKLSAKAKMGLGELAKVALHSKGETIFLPGDPSESVYFLKKGRVKLAHLDESGKKLTLTICERGEPFGEMALAGEDERSLIAETLEDVELCIVSKRDLLGFARDNPDFSLSITKLIGLRFVQIKNRLDELLFKNVRTRLARLFLKISDQFGEESEEGRVIKIRLTHQEISDLIGAARETTSTTIGEFESEGLIGKSGRFYVILNEAQMAQIAQQ